MKKPKIKLKSFRDLHDKWMKNSGFRKAYNDLEFEFKIIDALISARIQRKLTQKALAKKIGVAQPALARFESGRVNPSLSFLNKVTYGLGLELTVRK
jgi:DNA-binding XRE family transcriptional regulator